MPNPSSLINTYPPRVLSDIINEQNPDTIHVYIDLKNVLRSLFVEDVVREIVLNSQTMNNIDSSIFQSIIYTASTWKSFASRLGLTAKIFICSDVGKSSYHRSIYTKYKYRRDILNSSAIMGEKIKKIRDKNFLLAENICNRLPDVYFFCLKYLESDFLPYYLITRKFSNENIFHVVCSNDKDLYQTLLGDNVVQLYRMNKVNNILSRNSVLPLYLKLNKTTTKNKTEKLEKISKIDKGYLAVMMAIIGDASDDIPGIDGIGPVSIIKLFSQTDIVTKLIGTQEELEERVHNGGNVFVEDKIGLSQMPGIWRNVFLKNDLVTRAYKLISFESLCRWLEDGSNTLKNEYINYMDKLLNKEDIKVIPTSKAFITSLQVIEDLYLTEDIVDNIFGG
jgi:hypothetical protein